MPFKIASPSVLPAGLAPLAAAGQARQYTDDLNLKLATLRQQDATERRRAALMQADLMLKQQQMEFERQRAMQQMAWEQERFGQEQQYRRDALSLNQQELEYKLGALDQQREYQGQLMDFRTQSEEAKQQYYADKLAQQQEMMTLRQQQADAEAAWRAQQTAWQTENQQLKTDLAAQNQARQNRIEDRRMMESDRAAMQFQIGAIGKQIDDLRALVQSMPGGPNNPDAGRYLQSIQTLMERQQQLADLYDRRYGFKPTMMERAGDLINRLGSALFAPAPVGPPAMAPAPTQNPSASGSRKYNVRPVQ